MVNHLKTHEMYQKTSDRHSKDEEFNKVRECQLYRRKSAVGGTLVESESLQTASMAWADRGEGGEVIKGFHVTPRGRWGCWLMMWCHSEEFNFHRLPCCLSPLRWWWYAGEEKRGDGGVTKVKRGTRESSCVRASHLQPYYRASYILLTDKWLLGPTLIYLGERQLKFSPSSCFCRIWCLFLTSGVAQHSSQECEL